MASRHPISSVFVALAAAVVVPAVLATGCGRSESPKPAAGGSVPAAPSKAPAIPIKKAADWCKEHGVPESACTKCNADLVAQFKAKGDWCDKHGLPMSQCVACDPSLEAKLKAMAPDAAK